MRGRAGRMAYSASKWGLRGITKSFALEVGQYNINVNYVAPGMVDGPRFRDKVCADMAKKLNITVEEAAAAPRRRIRAAPRDDRQRCRECLPVLRERRVAPDHRRGPSGRRRMGRAMTADLILTGGKVVSPDAVIDARVAIKDGKILASARADAMPRREGDRRRLRHARAARRDRRACALPRSRLSAQGGLRERHRAPRPSAASPPCSTCRTRIPTVGTPEALAAKHKMAAEKAHVDFGLYAVLGEDTIEHVPALIETGVIGFKLYMGNTFGKIPSPSTGAMLEAFEVVAPTGKRISLHAETNSIMERRETPHPRGRPHRSARASRLAPGRGRDRGGEPRRDPRRMDRRAHPHPAHLVGRRAAPAARGQGARRRHHRRDLPALPDALGRRLCALRRRDPRQSAGAREAQPGAALGRARRRHGRPDRDRPRAAFARGEDPQRHVRPSIAASPASRRRCR